MSRLAASLLAAAVLLVGCGEPTDEEVRTDYCETVRQEQRTLSERLAEQSPTALLDARPVFERLAAAAPDDVADDWRVLLDALDNLDEALAAADVDPATYDPAKPPAGLDREARTAIERAAAELLNPRTREAVTAVDQQARDVCQTPLFQ